jgi:conjugative transfer signal peptidase TraF
MSGRRTRTEDAPLLAWGDALRAQTIRRARLVRRIAAVGITMLVVLASAALPPTPRLVWNASASAPIGLYWVRPGADLEPGDMVVAQLPKGARQMAARRRYLPLNVPLVKRVVAVAGDEVCALGKDIFLNGRRIAERRHADAQGRPMPTWSGCLRLRGRQLFLMMDASASFDGRYFGVTGGVDVVGKARLLWAR